MILGKTVQFIDQECVQYSHNWQWVGVKRKLTSFSTELKKNSYTSSSWYLNQTQFFTGELLKLIRWLDSIVVCETRETNIILISLITRDSPVEIWKHNPTSRRTGELWIKLYEVKIQRPLFYTRCTMWRQNATQF